MNKLNDTDLREALRRREAKRMQTEMPADFCDRVMQKIADAPASKPIARRWRTAMTALAAAASIALAVLLTGPKEQPIPSVTSGEATTKSAVAQSEQSVALALPLSYKTERAARRQPATTTRQTMSSAPTAIPAEDTPAATPSMDSLDYFISKVEQQLDKIRDSCYEIRVGRLLRADVRLQQLVTQIMADGIIADSLYITAQAE